MWLQLIDFVFHGRVSSDWNFSHKWNIYKALLLLSMSNMEWLHATGVPLVKFKQSLLDKWGNEELL